MTLANPSMATSATTPTSVLPDEPSWGVVARLATCRAIITVLASLLLWAVLPTALGWTPRVILSGSMEPRVHVGDIVVTRPPVPTVIDKGRVLTVSDPDHAHRTRTHRVHHIDDNNNIVLKGDANAEPDSTPVRYDDVLGVGVIRVPWIGSPAFWAAAGQLSPIAIAATLLVLVIMGAVGPRPPRRGPRPDPPDATPTPLLYLPASGPTSNLDDLLTHSASEPTADKAPRSRPSRRARRACTGLLATVVLPALITSTIVGATTHAAFAAQTVSSGNTFGASSNFYPYRTAVDADAPYLFWRLDETTGTVVDDETANNRDGTLVGSDYTWAQPGALPAETRETSLRVGVAAINANTSVTAPAAFTVEAWIKTTSTTGGRILGFGNATGTTTSTTIDRQIYMAPTGRVYVGVGTAKTTVASTAAINNNAWHHVVGTYTTGTGGLRLYVDGALQGTGTATAQNMTGYWRAAAEQLTGWPGNPTDNYFDGNLQELAVYTSALSAARVQAHYTAGTTP